MADIFRRHVAERRHGVCKTEELALLPIFAEKNQPRVAVHALDLGTLDIAVFFTAHAAIAVNRKSARPGHGKQAVPILCVKRQIPGDDEQDFFLFFANFGSGCLKLFPKPGR